MTSSERFWSKVDVRGADECWLWTASTISIGYGSFGWAPGDVRPAHRIAYELANGPIPNGMVVRHECDNPPCVNPRHLVVGSQLENIHDAMAKGRNAFGDKHGRRRLTSAQVAEMRQMRASGMTLVSIARKFGVAESTVSVNARGLHWKDADGPLVATSPRGQRP